MKGLKAVASVIVLSGLMVCAPKVNAEQLPTSKVSPTLNQSTGQNNVKNDFLRGMKQLESKDYHGAIKSFTQVLKVQPNSHYAYIGRSVAYIALKEFQQAKTDLDTSISINDKVAYAYYFRGFSHYLLGSKQEAITDLQTAANLFQKKGDAKLAQDSLDMIKKIRNA